MLVREYKSAPPSERVLAAELTKARQALERRKARVR